MSTYNKKCDRCGAGEDIGVLSDGFIGIAFAKNDLMESLHLKQHFDLCMNCFGELETFMNKKKS